MENTLSPTPLPRKKYGMENTSFPKKNLGPLFLPLITLAEYFSTERTSQVPPPKSKTSKVLSS